jgi:WD40 repeat protein
MIPCRMLALLLVTFALTDPWNGQAADPPPRTDYYDDPLPTGALARLGTVRWRASEGIMQMAFVPNSRLLATEGDSALTLWDLDTGRVARTITTDVIPRGGPFAFTPDGARLISANGPLHLWDVSSGQTLMHADVLGPTNCVAIRHDGLVAACANLYGDVYLWDLKKNAIRRVVEGDRRRNVHALSFAAGGKHLVVLHSSGGVSVRLDVSSGDVLRKTDLGDCGRVALAPVTGTIATYDHPNKLYLYDTATGARRRLEIQGKVGYLDLSFSPDGCTLLAMDRSTDEVQFWDVAQGKFLRRLHVTGLGATSPYADLLLSDDGRTLASYEGFKVLRIWNARTGQSQLRLPGHVFAPLRLAFSVDGNEVISHDGGLHRGDATTGKPVSQVSPDTPEQDRSNEDAEHRLAPTGRHLAQRVGRSISVNDTTTGKRLALDEKILPDSEWTITSDGRGVATLRTNREVHLWDVTTGQLLRHFPLEKKDVPISWLRVTPDGRLLATGEGWQKLHLWDASTGKHRATLTLPAEREPFQKPGKEYLTAITPNGRYLFVSSVRNLWIWDLVAGREIGPFEEDEHEWQAGGSGDLAVSPDGRLLAWFDSASNLRLIEICSGRIVHRFEDDYRAIDFAPSGWRLATSCHTDTSILIWDLPLLLRSQPSPCKENSPEALWAVLQSDDAVLAHRALWRLADLPEADAFLARHLHPVEPVPPERVRTLLADLGSEAFETRERANQALAAAGEAVRAALAEEVTAANDIEVRRRVEALQARLHRSAPDRLAEVRAVQVLEARGTTEARRLLQRLAAGVPEARLTQEAKEALARLR